MKRIIISETEKAKILNQHSSQGYKTLFNLITEADRRKDIKKFGFSDDIADALHAIDNKRSLWLANIVANSFAKANNIKANNLKELVSKIKTPKFLEYLDDKRGDINYILDWVKSPDREEINFKDIKTLESAYEKSTDWHNSLTSDFQITDESGTIVKTYPEGYYWIDLQTNYSEDEKRAMGHCGRDSSCTTLFSLRDKNKEPHATIGYDGKELTIAQVKGKQNKRPLDKYMKYVYDFIQDLIDNGQVKAFKWSYLVSGIPDLSLEEIGQHFGKAIKNNTIIASGLRALNSADIVTLLEDEDTTEKMLLDTIIGIQNTKFIPDMLTVAKNRLNEGSFNRLISLLINREMNLSKATESLTIDLTNNIIKSIMVVLTPYGFFEKLEDNYSDIKIISNNEYVIDVPSNISNLTNLVYANFDGSISSLPNEMSELSNLMFLSVSNNNHLSEIPDSLCNISTLEFITTVNTNVTIPECLSSNPDITILS